MIKQEKQGTILYTVSGLAVRIILPVRKRFFA
jgi:hypothetical protein